MSEASSGKEKLVLCPYCGHAQFGGDRCQACAGLFEPLSRRATQLAGSFVRTPINTKSLIVKLYLLESIDAVSVSS